MNKKLVVAVALWLFTIGAICVPGLAKADPIVLSGNLNAPLFLYDGPILIGNSSATSFSTGIGHHQAYTLASVKLDAYDGGAAGANLDLYTNTPSAGIPGATGLPGTYVGSLSLQGNFSTTPGTPTVFNGNGLSLAADSYYWLVLTPVAGDVYWGLTASSGGSGPGLQRAYAIKYAGDEDWTRNYGTAYGYRMEVDADASTVPVPPALLLFGSGLLGLIGLRRRVNI